MKQYLVLDYGGTAVKIALMDKDANRIEEAEKPAPIESLDKMIETAKEIAWEYKGRYDGVAISLPGIIDTEKGIAHMKTLRQQEKQIYRERKDYTMKFLSGGVLDGLLWRMRKRLLPLDYNSYNPYQLLLQ